MKSNLYFLVALFQNYWHLVNGCKRPAWDCVTDGSIYGYWQAMRCFQSMPLLQTHSPYELLYTTPIIPLLQPHQPTVSSRKTNQEAEETKDDFHTSQAPTPVRHSLMRMSGRALGYRNGGTRATPQGPVLLTSSSHLPCRRAGDPPLLQIIWRHSS